MGAASPSPRARRRPGARDLSVHVKNGDRIWAVELGLDPTRRALIFRRLGVTTPHESSPPSPVGPSPLARSNWARARDWTRCHFALGKGPTIGDVNVSAPAWVITDPQGPGCFWFSIERPATSARWLDEARQ